MSKYKRLPFLLILFSFFSFSYFVSSATAQEEFKRAPVPGDPNFVLADWIQEGRATMVDGENLGAIRANLAALQTKIYCDDTCVEYGIDKEIEIQQLSYCLSYSQT
jgi:hypothetical protein